MKIAHRFNALVDQYTESVVWMSYNLDAPVPRIIELDYRKHTNTLPEQIWPSYAKYELYWSLDDNKIYTNTRIDGLEFSRIQLLRAKCVAISTVDAMVDWKLKLLLIKQEDIEDMVDVYAAVHNITTEQSEKYVQFLIDERKRVVKDTEIVRRKATAAVQVATTLEAVDAQVKAVACMYNSINTKPLLNMSIITGDYEEMTDQSDMQGLDWFANLKNPQQQNLDTAAAEGLGSQQAPEQNVDTQQQPL